jgi:serine/threonine protein kinase
MESHSTPVSLITPIVAGIQSHAVKPRPDDSSEGMLGGYYVHNIKYGGMGEVFLCSFEDGGPPTIALKTFQKQFFFEPAHRVSFINESVNWSLLSGLPHIMPVVGIQEIEHRIFIAMPCVSNADGINSFRDELTNRAVSPQTKLRHFQQCLLGLSHANARFKSMVHGDIKPENMLLLQNEVYITDFGLSKTIAHDKEEADNAHLQLDTTWAYKAPELWDDPGSMSVKSDIYALGVILYEIICGEQPIRATSEQEFRHAHQVTDPARCDIGKLQPLFELAKNCLAKKPAHRPDYISLHSRLIHELNNIDPVENLMMLMDQVRLMNWFKYIQTELKPSLIRGLIRLERPDLALVEIENLEQTGMNLTSEILQMKASALSLTNRDEEAIVIFESLLAQPLDADLKFERLNELALSYKRTERFEEAERIYLDLLLPTSARKKVPIIVSNLATVYIQSRKFQKAVEYLTRMLRNHSDFAHGWANLGLAHFQLKNYEEAISALLKAIALDPGNTFIKVQLGEAYLWAGQLDPAYAILNRVMEQGYHSKAWFKAMIMTCLFLKKNDEVEHLLYIIRRDMSEEHTKALVQEIEKQMDTVVTEFRIRHGEEQPPEDGLQPAIDPADEPVMKAPDDQVSANAVGEEQQFSMPFLNFRMYMQDNTFSIDYYNETIDAEIYSDDFRLRYNQSANDPRFQDSSLRPSFFYFSECSRCGLNILTNRDVGKEIACRRCGNRAPSIVKSDAGLETLLSLCLEKTGLMIERKKEVTVVLLVQPGKEKDSATIRKTIVKAGYREIELATSRPAQYVHYEMVRKDHFSMTAKTFVFEKAFQSLIGYAEQTPLEVDTFIRDLQSDFGNIRTASSMYDTNPNDLGGLIYTGKSDQALKKLEQEMVGDPDDWNLLQLRATLLQELGRTSEALQIARSLLDNHPGRQQLYSLMGDILLKNGQPTDAIPYLQQASAMDPLDKISLACLVRCYEATGNHSAMEDVMTQLRTLGYL